MACLNHVYLPSEGLPYLLSIRCGLLGSDGQIVQCKACSQGKGVK